MEATCFLATLHKGPWHRGKGWFFNRLGSSNRLEASELHLPESRTDSLWVSFWPALATCLEFSGTSSVATQELPATRSFSWELRKNLHGRDVIETTPA